MLQNTPYLASGQSGYFQDQIRENGLGSQKLNPQDKDDAKFIASCFGKNINYSDNDIPIFYTTLLGTTEFGYATQSFPAGIMEDVFQCNPDHNFLIEPIVGESEEDFYLRLLDFQIASSPNFDLTNKEEVLNRGKRLINNFLANKSRIYLIKFDDIKNVKASFGDVEGIRNGILPLEESKQKIQDLPSSFELLDLYNIDANTMYFNPNMDSEYGIALYGVIPYDK